MSQVVRVVPASDREALVHAGVQRVLEHLAPGRAPVFLLVTVSPPAREREVAHAIVERLCQDSPIHEFRFTPESLDVSAIFQDLRPPARALVFLFGLSSLAEEPRAAALSNLNLARESLRASRQSFICFCDPARVREFATRAGDLHATISARESVELPAGSDLVPPQVVPLSLTEAQVLRRRAALYRDHLQQAWREGESRAKALLDLAEIYVRLGREEEGRKARDEGLGILAQREDHARVLEAYLHDLLEQTKEVRLSDLAVQAGHEILTVPLDEIFVPLTAVEELVRSEPELPRDAAPEDDPRIASAVLQARASRIGAREGRTLSLREILETQRAVVLGDPGSGKSTLLRLVARVLARSVLKMPHPEGTPDVPENVCDLTPILVPVVRLASRLTPEGRPDLKGFIKEDLSRLPGVGAMLARHLADGRAFLLIDGLDEVPASLRPAVRDSVEAYLSSHAKIPCLATSRIVGYLTAPLSSDFIRVRLQELDDEAIRRFALKWYQAIKQTAPVPQDAEVLAERLWEAISSNQGIRRIAGNPLLLTIIGLVHYRGSRLPEKRAEVYQAATRTLLENWLSRRPFVRLRSDELLRILPEVAFRIHEEVPTGLVTRGWLRDELSERLRAIRGVQGEGEESSEVDELLDTISQHCGLLLERGWSSEGQPLFGFLHLTFQEYLAATALFERWTDFALGGRGGNEEAGGRVENPIHRVLFSPRWQEVILLAAARASDMSQATATRFLQDVMEYQDRYEPILHRASLVAGNILAEEPHVAPDVARHAGGELASFWFEGLRPSRKAASEVLHRLGRSEHALFFSEPLLARLIDDSAEVRKAAAEALGALKDPRAVEPLLARLGDKSSGVRKGAAEALGAIKDARAVEPLLARLGDLHRTVRQAAGEALGAIKDARAVEPLLARLGDADGDVRQAAAQALGALRDPRALEPLLARLGDKSSGVRWAAAHALGVLKDPRAVEPLLARLGDEDPIIREAATHALGHFKDPWAVEPLLARLGDKSSGVRGGAAWALGALKDPRAVGPLIARLGDEEWFVRQAAAWALGELKDPRAVEALLARLGDGNADVREAAAEALGAIGGEPVVGRLEQALSRGEDAIDPKAAREALFLAMMNQPEESH